MNTTCYFRFPDEATFIAAMPAGFQQFGETGYPLPTGVEAIRIIGVMFEPGNDTAIAGFHVNSLDVVPTAWKAYQVFPATPDSMFGQPAPSSVEAEEAQIAAAEAATVTVDTPAT